MKVDADLYELARSLPYPQGAKFIWACMRLFMDGIESEEGELPKACWRLYLLKRQTLIKWRTSVLNGGKNNPRKAIEKGTDNATKKLLATAQETDAETGTESATGFVNHTGILPAETHNMGTHPKANQNDNIGSGMGATINNQESQINNYVGGASHAPRATHAGTDGHKAKLDTVITESELQRLPKSIRFGGI